MGLSARAGKRRPNDVELRCCVVLPISRSGNHAEVSRSGPFACQPRKMAGFVDEEKVAGIIKIFSDEFVCLEFELDIIVAFDLGRNIAAPQIHPHLPRTNRQLQGLRRSGFTCRLYQLPITAKPRGR
jgi:hypothetical protein